jgi:putative flavoprotein involved in K+ transport
MARVAGEVICGNRPGGFVHHSDVLRFVLDYATEIAAPVRTGIEVTSLSRHEDSGCYSLETADGRIKARHVIGTIIWASGYGYSFDWVKLPIVHANGTPVQQRGVTACPGVYFLGLHWMHTFRSAVLAFVGRDAAYLADHIDRLGAGLGRSRLLARPS